MRNIPEEGDVVALRRFAFTSKVGGTGLSDDDPKYMERFNGPAVVRVTKVWHDYETGWRYHGMPDSTSALLREYMARNARPGSPVYFGEFDLAKGAA